MSGRHAYPSDLTDAEWALVEPMLPTPACQTKAGGRPEVHDRRDVVDAIRYIVDNGCKWRALPDFGVPWQTIYSFFARWTKAGVVETVRDLLRERIRIRSKRCPKAVSVVVDSQSVKASETVSAGSRGYDANKHVNGRKLHLVVDGGGLLILVMVTPADVQDRDAGRELLTRLHDQHPEVTVVWADAAYSGELVAFARRQLGITLIVVKRPKTPSGSFRCARDGSSSARTRGSCGPAATSVPRTADDPQRGAHQLVSDHLDDQAPDPETGPPVQGTLALTS